MSTYLLVDYSNLVHRCKHISAPDIDTKTGLALHILLNSLKQVWRKFDGNHVVLCLDGKGWRSDFYPGYKAQRKELNAARSRREIEDDQFYFTAMNEFADFLKNKTNVTVLQSYVAEADDFIATWITMHRKDTNVIISGDSDFYQLLGENVFIYDGVKSWTISSKEILDENNKPATIKRNVKTKSQKTGRIQTEIVSSKIEPPDPEYELFKKIIRGDSSDNIMAAYPGVREKGNTKKPGILEAYNDRHAKGYEWNQFMLTEWNKLVGVDQEGNSIMKKVKVADEYKINKKLIDLTQQPQEIKDQLIAAISEAVEKPKKTGIGVWFLRFVEQMALDNIAKNPTEYARILASPYI